MNNMIPVPQSTVNLLQLGDDTVRAVDVIGDCAAIEMEKKAAIVRREAEEIAGKLEELAAAIRSHSKIAADRNAKFVSEMSEILESVRTAGAKLGKETDAEQPK